MIFFGVKRARLPFLINPLPFLFGLFPSCSATGIFFTSLERKIIRATGRGLSFRPFAPPSPFSRLFYFCAAENGQFGIRQYLSEKYVLYTSAESLCILLASFSFGVFITFFVENNICWFRLHSAFQLDRIQSLFPGKEGRGKRGRGPPSKKFWHGRGGGGFEKWPRWQVDNWTSHGPAERKGTVGLAQKGLWERKKSFCRCSFLAGKYGGWKEEERGASQWGKKEKEKFGCLAPSLFSPFCGGIVVVGGFFYKKGSLSVAAGMFGE